MSGLPVILPAAGLSIRHPGKLYFPINGRAAILVTVTAILRAGLEPHIVVGHDADKLRAMLSSEFGNDLDIIENPNYHKGMSTSLNAALNKLGAQDAFAIHLADKPFIQSETIRELTRIFLKQRPLAMQPFCDRKPGHPVFFNGSLKSNVLALSGDMGARGLLTELGENVHRVDTTDIGTILDMDRYLEQADG